ncbi:hypothetical protein BaRGS_00026149 [Batillaria attramentaria]|uniref:RRM domain-containing protein n=1 Tax=Batillaria attramentaria TaxID=370345 RepID=A0ABD0K6Q2_9CAEN
MQSFTFSISGNPKRVQTGDVLCMPGMAGTAVSEAEGLQTEGERQLKAMAQRQLRKDVTMTQLASERRQFTGAGQFKPVTKEIRGILQLQAYQEVAEGDNRVEMLRQCGLSEDEIRLKLASEGTAIGHNNTASRKSTFGENPDVQQEKLKAIEAKIKEKEGSLQNPDTFRGVKEISRQELDLEKSLFSGTDREGAALSHMLTREKAKVTGDPNDPINQLPQMMAEIEEKVQERIREKRRWRKRNRKNKRGNAEEFITENRLSLEDIRKLPKFQNYEAGNPANVLYLKNLSPRVSEHDLVALFGRFQKGAGSEVIYKLMTGRMRGQAFVTFSGVNVATQALQLVNGFMLHGKPVIAQYGKRTNA